MSAETEPPIPLTRSGKALYKRQFYRRISIFQRGKGRRVFKAELKARELRIAYEEYVEKWKFILSVDISFA